jgi:hypothetical protein
VVNENPVIKNKYCLFFTSNAKKLYKLSTPLYPSIFVHFLNLDSQNAKFLGVAIYALPFIEAINGAYFYWPLYNEKLRLMDWGLVYNILLLFRKCTVPFTKIIRISSPRILKF